MKDFAKTGFRQREGEETIFKQKNTKLN